LVWAAADVQHAPFATDCSAQVCQLLLQRLDVLRNGSNSSVSRAASEARFEGLRRVKRADASLGGERRTLWKTGLLCHAVRSSRPLLSPAMISEQLLSSRRKLISRNWPLVGGSSSEMLPL
jgi:hypothetical protein